MSHKNPVIEKERRKYPRLDVQIWAEEKNENSRSFHLVTNLSMGGLFLEKKLVFQPGSIVNLVLELDEEAIVLRGKIIDNYGNQTLNRSGAGVRFIDMDEKARSKLSNYLNKLSND